MKRAWTLAAVAVAVALTTAVVFADQEQSTGVIFARSQTVKYSPMMPGVSSYVAWGDTAKGPFGGFTRFRPGFARRPGRFHANSGRSQTLERWRSQGRGPLLSGDVRQV